jgi:hypothetical protein
MHLYQDGVPLSYIKDLLGHSNINTTSIYAMADLGMLRTALGNIENPLKEFAAPIDWKSEKEKLKALAAWPEIVIGKMRLLKCSLMRFRRWSYR